MGLKHLRSRLLAELHHPTSLQRYRERQDELVLKPYATPNDIIGRMRLRGDDWAEREVLTRSLIAGAQRDPGGPWMATLLLAYWPMLMALSRRRGGADIDDCASLLLVAFMEAVTDIDLEARRTHTCRALKNGTDERLRTAVRQRRAYWRTHIEHEADAHDHRAASPWTGRHNRVLRPVAEEADAIADLLEELAHGVLPPERLSVIVATKIHGERLRDIAQARCGDNEDAAQVYERMKRNRTRDLKRLRQHLPKNLCPRS